MKWNLPGMYPTERFYDQDIAETGSPEQIFENPQNKRTQAFLERFLRENK